MRHYNSRPTVKVLFQSGTVVVGAFPNVKGVSFFKNILKTKIVEITLVSRYCVSSSLLEFLFFTGLISYFNFLQSAQCRMCS